MAGVELEKDSNQSEEHIFNPKADLKRTKTDKGISNNKFTDEKWIVAMAFLVYFSLVRALLVCLPKNRIVETFLIPTRSALNSHNTTNQ